MMAVFEVHLVPGASGDGLLSAEMLRETGAQVMTLEEAQQAGFQGLEALAGAGDIRLIAVRRRDASWVHRALEASEAVASFTMHDVD